jgi:oligoribonuclease NrnB/cAMP/cGMP phosphodiesterase (DHH superfamily)
VNLLSHFTNKDIYAVHDSDLDGIGARVISECYLQSVAKKYTPLNTGERDMRDFDWGIAELSDIIIFVDITPTDLPMVEKINSLGKELFIFDHHLTGKETLGELPNYYFDEGRCGCRIYFEELLAGKRKKKIISDFVRLVDIYDRWLLEDPDRVKAESLFGVLFGYMSYDSGLTATDAHDKFIKNQLKKFELFPDSDFYFSHYENELIRKSQEKERKNYRVAKKNFSIRTDNSGNTYGYAECVGKMSIVANKLLTEYKDQIDYIVMHSIYEETYKNNPNGKLSLRSLGDFDVKVIAEKNGGGGHPNSCGCEIPLDDFYKLKEGTFHLI